MIVLVLFISHDANSLDLAHVHLSANSQIIGCSLISHYWIFRHTNTLFLLTECLKHQYRVYGSVRTPLGFYFIFHFIISHIYIYIFSDNVFFHMSQI